MGAGVYFFINSLARGVAPSSFRNLYDPLLILYLPLIPEAISLTKLISGGQFLYWNGLICLILNGKGAKTPRHARPKGSRGGLVLRVEAGMIGEAARIPPTALLLRFTPVYSGLVWFVY